MTAHRPCISVEEGPITVAESSPGPAPLRPSLLLSVMFFSSLLGLCRWVLYCASSCFDNVVTQQ